MTKPRTALFFDTETTGLPKFSLPSEDPSQPRITQIAAELINLDSREVLGAMNMLIKPDGWTIPEEVTAITSITTEKALAFGVPIEMALPVFLRLWNATTVHRVAHNETFDMRMIRIELKRSGKYTDEYADTWKDSPAFCTCSSTIKIVNAPPDREDARHRPQGAEAAEPGRGLFSLHRQSTGRRPQRAGRHHGL